MQITIEKYMKDNVPTNNFIDSFGCITSLISSDFVTEYMYLCDLKRFISAQLEQKKKTENIPTDYLNLIKKFQNLSGMIFKDLTNGVASGLILNHIAITEELAKVNDAASMLIWLGKMDDVQCVARIKNIESKIMTLLNEDLIKSLDQEVHLFITVSKTSKIIEQFLNLPVNFAKLNVANYSSSDPEKYPINNLESNVNNCKNLVDCREVLKDYLALPMVLEEYVNQFLKSAECKYNKNQKKDILEQIELIKDVIDEMNNLGAEEETMQDEETQNDKLEAMKKAMSDGEEQYAFKKFEDTVAYR